jgi:adenosylcobinamide-GDP ribazoletransferase
LRRAARGLLGAVAFLTVVPVPGRALRGGPFELAPSLPWFPLVGGAVGAAAGGLFLGLAPVTGRGPAAVFALAAVVLLTGALHQDGLADTFDGLGVRGDRARRLAVMRDSTVGTFGVLALAVWGLLLVTALDQLGGAHALRTLVAAEALARLAAVLHGLGSPPARLDGLGALMPARRGPVLAAAVLAVAIALLSAGLWRGGVAVGVAAAVALLSVAVARRAVGGSTGDTLGATAAVAEVLVCVALAATWR